MKGLSPAQLARRDERRRIVRMYLDVGTPRSEIIDTLSKEWGVHPVSIQRIIRFVQGPRIANPAQAAARTAYALQRLQAGVDPHTLLAEMTDRWGIQRQMAMRYLRRAWKTLHPHVFEHPLEAEKTWAGTTARCTARVKKMRVADGIDAVTLDIHPYVTGEYMRSEWKLKFDMLNRYQNEVLDATRAIRKRRFDRIRNRMTGRWMDSLEKFLDDWDRERRTADSLGPAHPAGVGRTKPDEPPTSRERR